MCQGSHGTVEKCGSEVIVGLAESLQEWELSGSLWKKDLACAGPGHGLRLISTSRELSATATVAGTIAENSLFCTRISVLGVKQHDITTWRFPWEACVMILPA